MYEALEINLRLVFTWSGNILEISGYVDVVYTCRLVIHDVLTNIHECSLVRMLFVK